MTPLRGQQLSLLPEVKPYCLSNPSQVLCQELSPEQLEPYVRRWVALVERAGGEGTAALVAIQRKTTAGKANLGGLAEGIQAPFKREDLYQACQCVLQQLQTPEQPDKEFQKGDRVLIVGCPNGYHNHKEAQVVRVNKKTLTLLTEGAPVHAEVRISKEHCWRLAPSPSSPEQSVYPHRRHSAKGKASGWIEERQGNRKRKTPSTSYYYCWLEQGARRKCYVPVGKLYRVCQLLDERRPVREIVEFLRVHKSTTS